MAQGKEMQAAKDEAKRIRECGNGEVMGSVAERA
jgi:hypothetical protein